MATDRLTAEHRRTLLALRETLAVELARIWPDADLTTFTRIYPQWEEAAYRLTSRYRGDAAKAGRDYVLAVRRAARAAGVFDPVQMSALDRERFAATMRATALQTLIDAEAKITEGRLSLAVDPAQEAAIRRYARARALVVLTGAASRQMIDGARDTIYHGVSDDSHAVGWARVTDGKPCAFCAMLASRGAVYKNAETAKLTRSGRRYHDHCACFPKPLYDHETSTVGRAEEFEQLWKDSTKGLSGKAAQNAFRRAYESRR